MWVHDEYFLQARMKDMMWGSLKSVMIMGWHNWENPSIRRWEDCAQKRCLNIIWNAVTMAPILDTTRLDLPSCRYQVCNTAPCLGVRFARPLLTCCPPLNLPSICPPAFAFTVNVSFRRATSFDDPPMSGFVLGGFICSGESFPPAGNTAPCVSPCRPPLFCPSGGHFDPSSSFFMQTAEARKCYRHERALATGPAHSGFLLHQG